MRVFADKTVSLNTETKFVVDSAERYQLKLDKEFLKILGGADVANLRIGELKNLCPFISISIEIDINKLFNSKRLPVYFPMC